MYKKRPKIVQKEFGEKFKKLIKDFNDVLQNIASSELKEKISEKKQ